MGTTAIPYSRFERRKAYFVIHLDKPVKQKRSFKDLILCRKPKQITERKFCIFNKDKTNYNFTDDVNKCHVFKFDTAVELAKKIGLPELKVSMIKGSPAGYILM